MAVDLLVGFGEPARPPTTWCARKTITNKKSFVAIKTPMFLTPTPTVDPHIPQLVKEAHGLDGLAQTHLVGEDGRPMVPPVPQQPVHPLWRFNNEGGGGYGEEGGEQKEEVKNIIPR